MAEYPRPLFYPSAKVILIPRFEEFGDKTKVPAPPKKRAPVRKGTGKDNTEALEVVPVHLTDGGYQTYVLAPKGADPNQVGGPQDQEGQSDDVVVVIPRSARLARDNFLKGATLDLELRYQDFPIDPRTIRACAVVYYLGGVTPGDFKRGVAGETRQNGNIIESLHIVPSEYAHNGIARTNKRFEGFVDEFEAEWDDTEPVVRLRCTDNTRILIDQEAPPQLSIDPKLPIHEAVARYMANFPQFVGLRTTYDGASPPSIEGALAKTAYQPKLGPVPKKKGDGSATAEKMSVWDYFTDLAGALGMIVRLSGVTVIFQYPRSLMTGSKLERRADDPWRPRSMPDGRVLERRTFVYGRNMDTCTFGRNFTQNKAQNIEIRSYNPKRKKTLVARFPLKEDRQVDVKPGDKSEQKWIVMRIKAVENDKMLKIIAQSYYEMMARNELTVKFTTKNLTSFGGYPEDTDILDMLPGDSIDVLTNRETDFYTTVGSTEESLVQRAREYMIRLGMSEKFADHYAKAFNSLGIQSLFKVRKLGIEWSSDDDGGVQIEVEGINYVTVRADKILNPDNQPEPEPDQSAQDTVETIDVQDQ